MHTESESLSQSSYQTHCVASSVRSLAAGPAKDLLLPVPIEVRRAILLTAVIVKVNQLLNCSGSPPASSKEAKMAIWKKISRLKQHVWPLTATLEKRLNAAHHRWQRSILGISWKDRVTNKEVRVRTGQHSMDDILSERRLRWFKRGPGRPRTNWRSTVNNDMIRMGITWEEAEVAAQNRSEWRRSVAQRILQDSRGQKVLALALNTTGLDLEPLGCKLNQGQGQV